MAKKPHIKKKFKNWLTTKPKESIIVFVSEIFERDFMPQFEVTYKIVKSDIQSSRAWEGSYSSHYTTTLSATHQNIAENMVRDMNGGWSHCHIIRARMI